LKNKKLPLPQKKSMRKKKANQALTRKATTTTKAMAMTTVDMLMDQSLAIKKLIRGKRN